MAENIKKCLEDIRILILDVDGVLTDGSLIINDDGSESKIFNSLDGHGIRLWRRTGGKVAFLSGRECRATKKQAENLQADCCIQKAINKMPHFQEILDTFSLKPHQAAYVGDDVMDILPIKKAGFGVAVANAVEEVKRHADLVTQKQGGRGAVREVIEHILKNTGKWNELMEKYLP